jgi:hypothetical protein
MDCQEWIGHLSDYIGRDLDEALHAEAQQHLASCHDCHGVLDTTQRTILLYREAYRGGIPLERRSRLFERLQQSLADRPDCP